jgi:hypothetical protein
MAIEDAGRSYETYGSPRRRLALFYHTRIRGDSSPFFRGVIKKL